MIYTITKGFHLTLPEGPGVYQYRDKDNQIIYIGKAKNLKKRISTYFHDNKQHAPKVKRMVFAARTVELIHTSSELEALLLEARLIRKHLPLYNRALRNYKAYPFIVLRTDLDFPYVEISRDGTHAGARYYGPYRRVGWLYEAVDALNIWLGLRKCTGPLPHHSCLYADLNQCPAPCIRPEIYPRYSENADRAADILSGDNNAMYKELEKCREEAAENLRFEEAQKFQTLLSLARHNGKIKRSVSSHHTLVTALDDTGELTGLVIIHGRLIQTVHAPHTPAGMLNMQRTAQQLYVKMRGTMAAPSVEEIDEMLIIASWLEYHTDELTVYPLNQAWSTAPAT
jgi:excinuclease ABC subunit C